MGINQIMNQVLETTLLGYSGHGKVVAEAVLLNGFHIIGYIDFEEKKDNPFNLEYLGSNNVIPDLINAGKKHFILGVGENHKRLELAELISSYGGFCTTIIHPEAKVSKFSKIGLGTFIARGVCINPFVQIGDFCIVNTAATIDHDSKIGDAVHIAPGGVVAGNTSIGKLSFVGANSVLINNLQIGTNVKIGAGSVVIKNIPNNSTVVGNPTRVV